MKFITVKDFNTPYADLISSIIIREWGYHYLNGFGFRNVSEYKLWKDDTFLIIAEEYDKFVGMIAFERYNIAGNSRFTPCICCLYVEPQWRNKGIGEALIQHMRLHLINIGIKEVYAWTIDKETAFWLETKGWRYVIDYNYLDRLVSILRADLL